MTIFAYIAHKDGKWGGVCSAMIERDGLAKFMAAFIIMGFDIMPTATREEYLAKLDSMKMWGDAEEAKPKEESA